jgi:SAM-dependent methyltransferase
MHCTLCETLLENQIDDKFLFCQNCNSYVMHKEHWLHDEEEKARYDLHNNDITDPGYINFVSPITNAIMNDFAPNHSGLDYGCGPGPAITHELQKSAYQVQLYDPFFHPDLSYLEKQYDYIFSCEVFEHFFNPKEEIEKLIKLLKHGGKLYIMTHLFNAKTEEFQNWYYKKDPTHVFIYTSLTMNFIAEKYDVTLEKIEGRLIVFRKAR